MTSEKPDKGAIDVDFQLPPSLAGVAKSCTNMAEIDPRDTRKVAAQILDISLKYYGVVREQAQKSFRSALWVAGFGSLFFFYACLLAMEGKIAAAGLSMIAGALVQVISGVNFYLYSKTAQQFAGFHICLERMDRYLLANSFCENLTSEKDGCRRRMIEVMVTAPMLTLEQVGISAARSVPQPERAASAATGL